MLLTIITISWSSLSHNHHYLMLLTIFTISWPSWPPLSHDHHDLILLTSITISWSSLSHNHHDLMLLRIITISWPSLSSLSHDHHVLVLLTSITISWLSWSSLSHDHHVLMLLALITISWPSWPSLPHDYHDANDQDFCLELHLSVHVIGSSWKFIYHIYMLYSLLSAVFRLQTFAKSIVKWLLVHGRVKPSAALTICANVCYLVLVSYIHLRFYMYCVYKCNKLAYLTHAKPSLSLRISLWWIRLINCHSFTLISTILACLGISLNWRT
jgi:hypothetical protein